MRFIALIIVAVIIAIVGIGDYLAPNDLAGCDEKPSAAKNCQKADGIVAISGGDTQARTDEAIKLYKNGWADTLIFSGAAQDKSGPSNAEAMRRHAVEEGVPSSAVLVEEASETTRQNAEQTQDLLLQRDIDTVILVTSAYHQRRASLEFKERMGGLIKVVNHPVSNDNQWSSLWWMTPIGWWLAIGELVKIGAFYLGGSR